MCEVIVKKNSSPNPLHTSLYLVESSYSDNFTFGDTGRRCEREQLGVEPAVSERFRRLSMSPNFECPRQERKPSNDPLLSRWGSKQDSR